MSPNSLIAISLLFAAGAVCRWVADKQRVTPRRRFTMAQRGYWLPPFPMTGEFVTVGAWRTEVLGRVLVLVAEGILVYYVLHEVMAGFRTEMRATNPSAVQ